MCNIKKIFFRAGLCTALLASPSLDVMAQITLSMNNRPMREVIQEIEKVSDYRFFYSENLDGLNTRVSINSKNASIENILNQLEKQTSVSCALKNNGQVVLSNETKPLQQRHIITIKGKVLDKSGEPIIGANVIEKGTVNGTITDLDGNFTLNVNTDSKLVVSFIGYETVELKVDNKKELNITLKDDTETLDEVVVVGYGTQKKMNLTGAVSTMKADDFVADRPVASLGQSLQGKVAGLQINKSNGKPGGGYSFNLRGTTSLNGGGPLVLIDGVEGDINMVPPEDVESVSVLKDASSAAIYGSRAAFGVVLVTTKSGQKDQKVRVNYSNNFSWSNPTCTPEKVDPVTQITMGAYAWGNKTGDYKTYWHHDLDTWLNLYETIEERNTYRWVGGKFYPIGNTDMIKELTESGFMQRHNLSVSGGSKRVAYYVNAGLMKQNGVLLSDRDKYTRKNVSLKLDSEITDWLTAQISTGYTRGKQEFPWIPQGDWYLYDVSYMRPTFWLTGMNEELGLPFGYTPHIIEMGAPCYTIKDVYNFQAMTTVKPIKGLEITGRYTYRTTSTDDKYHVNSYMTSNPASGGSEYYRNQVNSLQLTNGKNELNVIDIWAKYNKTFANAHNFSVMVGFNQESSKYKSFYAKAEELFSDNLPALSLSSGQTYVGDSYTEWSTRSAFYRLNYDYKGKYLFEAVGRYDGSSKFAKNDRFVFFPSFSLGWRLSDESFMNWSKKFLSNMKLRASFGQQGNQAIGAYAYTPSMGVGKKAWLVDGKLPTMMTPAGIVSDSFTWETVKNLNFGVDLGMFNNRLNATFEYYIRKTEDMLLPGEVLPSILGTSVPKENAGDLRVNGWELSMDWKDRIGKVNYNIGFVLSDSKTKITKFSNPTKLLKNHYVGEELGAIWGYETDRLFTEDDFIINENGKRDYKEGIPRQDKLWKNRIPMPGDVKYKDLNGDGKIDWGSNTLEDPGDRKVIGNSRARYQFGINMGAQYQGIDLTMFFQGVGKRDVWIGNSSLFAFAGSYDSLFKHTTDFWTPENTDAFYPRPVADRDWNRQVQTRYLQSSAYIRLKNMTIGYSLPMSVLEKINLQKVRIFFSGENLFTITGLPKGLDPEIAGARTYPFAKEISFGVDVSF